MNRYRAYVEAEIDAFIASRLVADKEATVRADALYIAYAKWAENSPLPPMTETMFGRIMPTRHMKRRFSTGMRYLGVRLA